ncbi:MAG: class I SAM-dependent rRNA methyltransferase [Desertimonas sp.]
MSGPRLAVRISADALRQIRGGHPWVYADAITSISRGGSAGDLAVVFDDRRRFAAIGLYDPDSPIRIKILHHGDPTPIDRAWWIRQVSGAMERRSALAQDQATTAWRVVHGENDGLPGLVVDRYADTAVVKIYSAALIDHLDDIVAGVETVLHPARIVLRASRQVVGRLPGRWAAGTVVGHSPTGPIEYRELGLTFAADVVRGQKTGAFLDQRDNRALVARHAAGRSVLDVFCCTGGFAVHAAAGGAGAVHLVDQSAGAIDTARANLDRNGATAAVTSTVGDAFATMEHLVRQRKRFGVVVIDPPSFAPNQAAVPAARHAYRRLTRLGIQLVEPGGVLFQASCSSRIGRDEFVTLANEEIKRSGARFDRLAQTGHPLDHPIGFAQGAYLKALLGRVGDHRHGRAR